MQWACTHKKDEVHSAPGRCRWPSIRSYDVRNASPGASTPTDAVWEWSFVNLACKSMMTKERLLSLRMVQVAMYHILWCTHGMAQLELPRSHMGKTNFACLTCSYVVGQCSIPYSVCGRGSSTCFNLYIMGSGRWPPEPVWVIPDVYYTCTLAIIDLQVNVKIIQVFTASVGVVAPGAPLRAS